MQVGDKVKLKIRPPGCEVGELAESAVGTILDIDATSPRTAFLIRFPELDLYTSALQENDFEVLEERKTALRVFA